MIRALICLISVLALTPGRGLAFESIAGHGQVLYEVWPGSDVRFLEEGADWMRVPTMTTLLSECEAINVDVDVGVQRYLGRLSTIVTIPEDGDYRFWLAGEHDLRLYASFDGNPENSALIADAYRGTRYQHWKVYYQQGSQSAFLQKGTEVFLTALQIGNSQRGDCVSVGWSRGKGPIEVISGAYCRTPLEAWGAVTIKKPSLLANDNQFIEIQWPRLNLGLGVTSYTVYRNGRPLAEDIKVYDFLDDTVVAGETYTYSVQAVDLMGRKSEVSSELKVTARSPSIKEEGTGLTAAYYIPGSKPERGLGVFPQMKAIADATCFLRNRKGEAVYLNNVQPSFRFYRDKVIYLKDFTDRSVRMEGFIEPPHSGEWTFTVQASDQLKLWLNKQLLIQTNPVPGPNTWNVRAYLKGGEKVPFSLECQNRTIQIEWEHHLRRKEVIPLRNLYPNPYLDSQRVDVLSSSKSYTNPAHLEINCGSEVTSVSATINDNPLKAVKLNPHRILFSENSSQSLGVKLKPDQINNVVLSHLTKGEEKTTTHNIQWIPVLLGAPKVSPSMLTVREGDELRFQDSELETPLESLQLNQGDEEQTVSSPGGRYRFQEPGQFRVRRVNDTSGDILIRVVPASQREPVAILLGYYRYVTLPPALRGLPVSAGDDRIVGLTVSKNPWYIHSLELRSIALGQSSLVFRSRPGGPVVAMLPTDAFGSWFQWARVVVDAQLSRRVNICIVVTDIPKNLEFEMFARSRFWICENGGSRQRYDLSVFNRHDIEITTRTDESYGGNHWFEMYFYQNGNFLSLLHSRVEP